MTESSGKSRRRPTREMRSEYAFDYSKSRPNRFAVPGIKDDQLVIVLDVDVARAFRDSKTVNAVLRALLKTMPKSV